MRLLFVSNLFPDAREAYRGLDNATLLHWLARDWEIRAVAIRPVIPLRPAPDWTPRAEDAALRPVYVRASYVPKVGSRFNHVLMARALREPLQRLVQEFRPDAILCAWLYPDACAIARLVPELGGIPFVAIAQGSDVHSYLRMPVRGRLITDMARQSAGVITRSADLARRLEEAGVPSEKLHPIYNGVEVSIFHPGDQMQARQKLNLPLDGPVILFVGNFLPVKNPFLLLEARAELRRRNQDRRCRLVLIGGGPLEGAIRNKIAGMGLDGEVILAGRKTADEVADYMRAADALCLSSENEGVPNVVLEAFATGLRVVATDVGGISEVLCHDFLGRLVKPRTPGAFADALHDVLNTAPQSKKILQHAAQFTWERTAEDYRKVLSRG